MKIMASYGKGFDTICTITFRALGITWSCPANEPSSPLGPSLLSPFPVVHLPIIPSRFFPLLPFPFPSPSLPSFFLIKIHHEFRLVSTSGPQVFTRPLLSYVYCILFLSHQESWFSVILRMVEIEYHTIFHLLCPVIYMQQSQNNAANAGTTSMIIENSLRLFAVPFGSGHPLLEDTQSDRCFIKLFRLVPSLCLRRQLDVFRVICFLLFSVLSDRFKNYNHSVFIWNFIAVLKSKVTSKVYCIQKHLVFIQISSILFSLSPS